MSESKVTNQFLDQETLDDLTGYMKSLLPVRPPASQWFLLLSDRVGMTASVCLDEHTPEGIYPPELRSTLMRVAAIALAWRSTIEDLDES